MLITLVFCAGATGAGLLLFGSLLKHLDPALRFGVAALLGLGVAGFATLPIGLLPGGLSWGLWVMVLYAGTGLIGLYRAANDLKLKTPSGAWLLIPLAAALAAFMALVGALSPADTNEWDSLAYHLAVPKLWIQHGQIDFIPYIHHSNFPFAVDNLYIWGLQWGGQSGAKGFQFAYYLIGMVAVFGVTRQRYDGQTAPWWALLVYATIPAALWEGGTAYIDLAHGLYAGFGILFAALWLSDQTKGALWLSALLLGLAAASKYTGLQTIFAVGVVLAVGGLLTKQKGLQSAILVGALATAIATPWLIRNQVHVGNPVYPFFYEQLGSKNWDQPRAVAYKNEQQTFGVGRTESGRDPTAAGHALLGLAYQPGRYVNPGQTAGLGSPLGAVGCAVIAALMMWLLSGRIKRFEGACIAAVLVSAAMWFFLSQQSRYILTWAIPLSVLGGGAIVRLAVSHALAVVVGIQAVATLYLGSSMRLSQQLPVALGSVSPEEYQRKNIAFYEPSLFINELGKSEPVNVALYDEVFGYLLDVPYFWANPGHSTVIPYDRMSDGASFATEMKRLGFTHAYLSLSSVVQPDRAFLQRWLGSMELQQDQGTLTEEERTQRMGDWQSKWQILLADAVQQKLLTPVQGFRSGILFKINP